MSAAIHRTNCISIPWNIFVDNIDQDPTGIRIQQAFSQLKNDTNRPNILWRKNNIVKLIVNKTLSERLAHAKLKKNYKTIASICFVYFFLIIPMLIGAIFLYLAKKLEKNDSNIDRLVNTNFPIYIECLDQTNPNYYALIEELQKEQPRLDDNSTALAYNTLEWTYKALSTQAVEWSKNALKMRLDLTKNVLEEAITYYDQDAQRIHTYIMYKNNSSHSFIAHSIFNTNPQQVDNKLTIKYNQIPHFTPQNPIRFGIKSA